MTKPEVFLEGLAIEVSWADASRSLTDFIFETVRASVDDAAVSMEAIDSVVISAHDLVDGRSLSSMVTAPAAGAYLRDEVRLSDDGAASLAAAVTRLEAGHNERSIVAAWGRASEHDVTAVSQSLFEPIFHRALKLQELDVSAMRAHAWLQQHSQTDRDAASERRVSAVAANPRASARSDNREDGPHPLRAAEQPLWADVVVSCVISTEPSSIRISGVGQSSEVYRPGDRDLLGMPALTQAVAAAMTEAAVSSAEDLDVIELDGLTLFDEAIGMEAAGVAPPGGGFTALAHDPRCNPSGGSAAGYCAPAMGLARIAEAVLQLRGQAGPTQLAGVRSALATGSSTLAGQTHTAIVLESV